VERVEEKERGSSKGFGGWGGRGQLKGEGGRESFRPCLVS